MFRHSRLTPLLLLLTCSLAATKPLLARHERKDAMKAFQAGDYERAFQDILVWCKKKPNDKDGHEALRLIVPNTFQVLQSRALEAESTGRWKEAVEYYRKMTELARDLATLPPLRDGNRGVVPAPESPSNLESLVREKSRTAARHYFSEAESLDSAGQFKTAATAYRLASEMIPNFQNSDILATQALQKAALDAAEKSYREGLDFFKQGQFRRAYLSFQAALSSKSDYKDAQRLMTEARDKGRVRLAVVSGVSAGPLGEESRALARRLLSQLLSRNNPFLDFVEVPSAAKIDTGGAGNRSLGGVPRAGVDVLVAVEVLQKEAKRTDPQHAPYDAFQWFFNPSRKLESKKVSVDQIRIQTSAKYEVQFRLVDNASAAILDGAILNRQAQDAVEYAVCKCDPSMLFNISAPPNVVEGTVTAILAGFLGNRLSLEPFRARKQLVSEANMVERLVADLTREMADRVLDYLDRRFDRYPRAAQTTTPHTEVSTPEPTVLQPPAQTGATPSPPTPPIPPENPPVAEPPQDVTGQNETVQATEPGTVPSFGTGPCDAKITSLEENSVTIDAGEEKGVDLGVQVFFFPTRYRRQPSAQGQVTDVFFYSSVVKIEGRPGPLTSGMCVRFVR